MADGSIEFKTDLDNSDLEKKLKDAEKSVDKLKGKIESEQEKKTFIERAMERNEAAIHDTEAEIDRLKQRYEQLDALKMSNPQTFTQSKAEMGEITAQIAEQEKSLAKQIKDQDALNDKWQQSNDKTEYYTERLAAAESKERELGAEAQAAAARSNSAFSRASTAIRERFSSLGASVRTSMANAANGAVSPWENFGKRVNTMLKKVFVFGMILKGIRSIKSAISDMLANNQQLQSSVANLKSVMGGFLSAMVSTVAPALVQIVNMLAGVFERVAGFIDQFFGTNIVGSIQQQRADASAAVAQANAQKRAEYESQVAKAEERQAKAAGKLAKNQEKANRQLMAFDEINALTAESTEDAADEMEYYFEGIEQPTYEADPFAGLDVGNLGFLQGILDWLDEIRNRIANDVEGPFARIREGLDRIKEGWDKFVTGIQTGDIGLVMEGLRDMVIGSLYVIEGALTAFLDWLDEVTGGRFHTAIEGLKQMLHGIVEFIEGVLTGNFELAFQGLHDIVNGFVTFFEGLWESLIMWLDEITGGQFHDVLMMVLENVTTAWEGIRQVLNGVIEFIQGVLSGNLQMALDGLGNIVDGFVKFITGLFDGAVGIITALFDGLFDTIENIVSNIFDELGNRFPQLKGLFDGIKTFILGGLETLRGAVHGVIDFVSSIVHGLVDGLGQMFKGLFDVIVGLFTGNIDLLANGVKAMLNGVITVFEGAVNGLISGAVSFLNGIISAANKIPGVSIGYASAPSVSLPRLATGAVIPPNREFLAVLGDQTRGTNIEAPESLIRQIVREESGNAGNQAAIQAAIVAAIMQLMPQLQSALGGDVLAQVDIDGDVLARQLNERNDAFARRGMLNAQFGY